ncbi:MAG: thermonuclease family protein [Deltaproteobacteria bacterium]|nr:thermonuclease family protein [Deltaproteobacteria bacterium]
MPRITGGLNNLGVRGFWLPLFLSSAAISVVTNTLMTGWQRLKYDQFAPGQNGLQQWSVGLLMSIPSTMLGMGGSQVFRNISQFLVFDAGTEVVQAFASAGIGSTLESTGLQQKRDLTAWQRIGEELATGLLYMGMGRFVGGTARGYIEAYEPTKQPFTWVSGEKVGQRLRFGIDTLVDRLRSTEEIRLAEMAAMEVGALPLRPDLPPGIDLDNPPWISAPWKRGSEDQARWYPERTDDIKQVRANRIAAYALRTLVRRHTRNNLRTRIWHMIDESTRSIRNPAEKQRVRAELAEALLGPGARDVRSKAPTADAQAAAATKSPRERLALERELGTMIDRVCSGIRSDDLRAQLRTRLEKAFITDKLGSNPRDKVWNVINDLTKGIGDPGEKRRARGQLAEALLGPASRGGGEARQGKVALEDQIWEMINRLTANITDTRVKGRLRAQLSDNLIRMGLRKGQTIYTDVPYIADLEFQVRRVRDGKYMDPAENPFFFPVVDGDTIHVWAEGMRESISIRFACANTLEATHEYLGDQVLPPEWRCLRGEFGAYGGWKFLQDLLAAHDNKVYLRVYEVDDYGRPVCEVYLKKKGEVPKGEDPYINVNLELVRAGWAHAYFITPDSSGMIHEYIAAQEEARAARRGIWQHPVLASEDLFVTSYHGYAHQMDPAWKPSRNDRKSPANKEYLRVFNTSTHYVNLKGYKVKVGDRVTEIKRDFWLPPAHGVKLYSHSSVYDGTPYNMNGRAEMFIDLELDLQEFGSRRKDHHFWHQDDPLELIHPDGHLMCQEAASAAAFAKLDPKFRALRGHVF